jgi:stage III sporulation protein AE
VILLLLLLSPKAQAADLSREIGADSFSRAAEAYLEGYLDVEKLTGDSFSAGAAAVLEGGLGEMRGLLRRSLKSGILLLAVALLCSFAETVREDLGGGLDPVRLAGAAAVTSLAVADIHTLMGLGKATLEELDAFSKLLLPVVTAAGTAAGRPAAAVARQGAVLLFLGLLLTLADRLALPLIYAYVAACAAHAALGNEGLKRLAGMLKWTATGLLSLLLTGFVFYLSVTGAVAGSADAMAQKAAKTAISGMIPVVGGILSDAAETVAAGAGVVKGTVGVVGLLAVLAVCLIPFLRLGVHYLVYKGAATLTATVINGPMAGLMDSIGSAFALMLGLVGGGGMILYIALITSIQAVGGG